MCFTDPYEEYGWIPELKSNHELNMEKQRTCLMFHKYKLFDWDNAFMSSFHGKKQSQVYICNQFAKIEANDFEFISRNQKNYNWQVIRTL